ncbi:hypothetical protein BY458DRAFT_558360 [Sporodiniella umbellata]|nr:hypothetical protein BY458DRAFT_558360 [Sporodiniella umbellata]
MNSFDKPTSFKSIEIQKAIIPETMRAVTQDTKEYLRDTIEKDSLFQYLSDESFASPTLQQQVVPRSSSKDVYSKSIHLQQNESIQPMGYDGVPQTPKPQSRPGVYSYNSVMTPTSQQHSVIDPLKESHTTHSQSRIQKTPGECDAISPIISKPNQERNSPLLNPKTIDGDSFIRRVLYTSHSCKVFHWNNQSWYATDGQCFLQVRLTQSNRTCVTVELQNKGQLYLNAWILSSTVVRQPSPTDVSLSVFMGERKENYLIHLNHPEEASSLFSILKNTQAIGSCLHTDLEDDIEPVNTTNCLQTLSPVIECKAKLYVQTETSKWTTFGSVSIVICQQKPSMRTFIQIQNEKTKLVSAVVKSGNVEKISAKRISFLLTDEIQKTSIVYMIHLREEETGNKVYEQIRLKNAEYGW